MNRRRLLQMAGSAVLLPLFQPLLQPGFANAAQSGSRRIILIELAGANDGLNTIVPYADDHYFKLRPQLALDTQDRISLTDQFAVNSALKPLLTSWESGELAIVHGLGYPLPNRSHFKSMALWETGGDGMRYGKKGWITHDLEHAHPARTLDAHGMALGGELGVFSGASGSWLSMSSLGQFAGGSLKSSLPMNGSNTSNPGLSRVMEQAKVLDRTLTRISAKLERKPQRVQLGNHAFAQQGSHVVNLINAGVNVPIFKLSLDGFDTHEKQQGRHEQLLSQLSRTLSGIRQELKRSGQWDTTLIATYSEFGRRAQENNSGGTDHGTAAPHLIMGGGINGGFYGTAPALDQLLDGDLQHTMDYRAVYSALLEQWLKLPTNAFSTYQDNRLSALC